jgi:hypothetical protein
VTWCLCVHSVFSDFLDILFFNVRLTLKYSGRDTPLSHKNTGGYPVYRDGKGQLPPEKPRWGGQLPLCPRETAQGTGPIATGIKKIGGGRGNPPSGKRNFADGTASMPDFLRNLPDLRLGVANYFKNMTDGRIDRGDCDRYFAD